MPYYACVWCGASFPTPPVIDLETGEGKCPYDGDALEWVENPSEG